MSLANLATIPVVTDIKWNQAAFNNAGDTAQDWSQKNKELKQQDNKLLVEGVVDAYSRMQVEKYVNFSKTFSPFVKFESHVVDAVTPVNQKVCEQPKNQAAATECLNNWMLAGMQEDQKDDLKACFRKAGCASVWMDATPAQRAGAKKEFQQSVGVIAQNKQAEDKQFMSGLKTAWTAHEERVAHMHVVFREYFVKATTELGCDRTCTIKATANNFRDFGKVMQTCQCGAGAWAVNRTNVNVMAATENVYGDLENLNEVDIKNIQSALIRMDM